MSDRARDGLNAMVTKGDLGAPHEMVFTLEDGWLPNGPDAA
jgi:hypothetical protein